MEWVFPPEEPTEGSHDPYRSYGRFEPFAANRLLKRFKAEKVRFQIADGSGLLPVGAGMYEPPVRIGRTNVIEIFVHKEDDEKARKIIGES